MDLLPFLDESVILRHTFEGQLFHQVDLVWIINMLALITFKITINMTLKKRKLEELRTYHELLHGYWERCRVQKNLALARQERYNTIQHAHKILGE